MRGRIYNEKIEIDREKVKSLFNKYFIKDNPLASVMLREKDDNIAVIRNANELALLSRLIDLSTKKTIFDIGCGMGRWATNLSNSINHYDGVDYSSTYINVAKSNFIEKNNICFYQMDVLDLSKEKFYIEYDLIIVNAICLYLNDDILEKLIIFINSIMTKNTLFYLRESVSVINERLTLKDFPSDELKTEYNAIYRTPEEYEDIIKNGITNVEIISTDFLLTEETGARKETNQRYWLLKKK